MCVLEAEDAAADTDRANSRIRAELRVSLSAGLCSESLRVDCLRRKGRVKPTHAEGDVREKGGHAFGTVLTETYSVLV